MGVQVEVELTSPYSCIHSIPHPLRMDQLPSPPTPVIGVAQSMKFNQEAHSKQLQCQMHYGKER